MIVIDDVFVGPTRSVGRTVLLEYPVGAVDDVFVRLNGPVGRTA